MSSPACGTPVSISSRGYDEPPAYYLHYPNRYYTVRRNDSEDNEEHDLEGVAMRERFEVAEVDGKFGLYLDGHQIGTSKLHCDCDNVREIILQAMERVEVEAGKALLRAKIEVQHLKSEVSRYRFPDTTGQ